MSGKGTEMFFYKLGKDVRKLEERVETLLEHVVHIDEEIHHLHEMVHHQHKLLHAIIRMLQDNKDGMTKEEIDKITKEANEIADRLGAINRPPTNVTTGPVSVPKSASNVPK